MASWDEKPYKYLVVTKPYRPCASCLQHFVPWKLPANESDKRVTSFDCQDKPRVFLLVQDASGKKIALYLTLSTSLEVAG